MGGEGLFRGVSKTLTSQVDFICLEKKLIVEADGGQHSEEVDAARTAYLRARGFRVVRYWNNDILKNIDGVLEHLASVLTGEL